MKKIVLGAGIASLLAVAVWVWAQDPPKPNPDVKLPDYRNWTHVKTMVIHDKKHPLYEAFGGMHHVYANEIALPSTKEEKFPYPDGSALVFVLHDIKEETGAFVATDAAKIIAVVIKDSEKYKETGGWAFQAWNDQGVPIVVDGGKSCFECHLKDAAKTDYIFSRFERQK
jgi:hypothetical protein